MPIFGDRPYTSITVKINQLSNPHRNDDVDDSIELYVSDLLQLIKIQPNSGASEAARAIRKKVKYGESTKEQLRALNLLELLVLNSGQKIGSVIARDDKLLDVLKGILTNTGKTGTGASYPKEVQAKVRALARGWKTELEGLEGYKFMATLWQYIPKAKRSSGHSRTPSGKVFETSPDGRSKKVPTSPYLKEAPPRPSSSSPYISNNDSQANKDKMKKKKRKKNKRNGVRYADELYKIPQINYKVEAPKIRTAIADCYTHTTALNNALIALPAGNSPLDDPKASSEFDKCRPIRRKILTYLQYVGAGDQTNKNEAILAMDEEFLGSLIGANEQLVKVFKKFDSACGYSEENPAPNYDDEDDDDSDESYYTDESSDDDYYDDNIDSVADRLNDTILREPSSNSVPAKKSPPPPRPAKPSLLTNSLRPAITLAKSKSNDTLQSDPFDDGHALTSNKSIYD